MISFKPHIVKHVWDNRTLYWGIEVHIAQHYEYYPRNHADMTPEEQDDWHDDEDMNHMWIEPHWEEFHGDADGSWINALDAALDIIDTKTVIPRPSLDGQAEFLFTDDELSEIWYSPDMWFSGDNQWTSNDPDNELIYGGVEIVICLKPRVPNETTITKVLVDTDG